MYASLVLVLFAQFFSVHSTRSPIVIGKCILVLVSLVDLLYSSWFTW